MRWFDHWLKDNDTGLLEEPRVQVFLDGGEGEWIEAKDWPLPQTRWTPFYLHEQGLLSEHEFWPNEAPTVYVDSPYERGSALFQTPAMVETTDICGPMSLTLYASIPDSEVLWFVQLLEIDREGRAFINTRLASAARSAVSIQSLSKPWAPYHTHERREPLTPNEIYEFSIEIRPYGIRLRPGYRLADRYFRPRRRATGASSARHRLRSCGAPIELARDDIPRQRSPIALALARSNSRQPHRHVYLRRAGLRLSKLAKITSAPADVATS